MPTENAEEGMDCFDEEAIDQELGELAVDILLLSQELINTKLKLEDLARNGWVEMARARYHLGPNSVSSLQLPTVDQEKPVRAQVKTHLDQCIRSDGHVRYNYLSLAIDGQRSSTDIPDGVRLRKTTDAAKTAVVESSPEDPVDNKKTEDPIRWFAMLPPSPLKQSQGYFRFCIEVVLEAANIQCEIRGVQDRIKFLNRTRRERFAAKTSSSSSTTTEISAATEPADSESLLVNATTELKLA